MIRLEKRQGCWMESARRHDDWLVLVLYGSGGSRVVFYFGVGAMVFGWWSVDGVVGVGGMSSPLQHKYSWTSCNLPLSSVSTPTVPTYFYLGTYDNSAHPTLLHTP